MLNETKCSEIHVSAFVSFAILINSKDEGDKILNIIKSNKFKKLIKESCSWSNFRIDWRLFTNFKKDFYKEFNNTLLELNNNDSDDNSESENIEVKKKVSKTKKLTK